MAGQSPFASEQQYDAMGNPISAMPPEAYGDGSGSMTGELTPEQWEAVYGTGRQVGRSAASVGAMAFPPAALPLMAGLGAESTYQAYKNPSADNIAQAGADVGLMPFGGAGGMTGKLIEALTGTSAKLVGITGGLTVGATAGMSEAEAKAKARKESKAQPEAATGGSEPAGNDIYALAAKRDPRVKAALDDKARIQSIIENETKGRGGYGPKAQAAQVELDKANVRLEELVKQYLPFDQQYPALSQARPMAQLVLPGVLGYATKSAEQIGKRIDSKFLSQNIDRLNKNLDGSAPDFSKATAQVKELENRLDRVYPKDTLGGKVTQAAGKAAKEVGTAGAGAFVGAEIGAYPENYNRSNTLPGTDEHTKATKAMTPGMGTDELFGTTAGPAVMGAIGAMTGRHLPNIPNARPRVDEARSLIDQGKAGFAKAKTDGIADTMKVDAMTKSATAQKNVTPTGGGSSLPNGAQGAHPNDLRAASAASHANRQALHARIEAGGHPSLDKAVQEIVASNQMVSPRRVGNALRQLHPDGRIDGVKINDGEVARMLKKAGFNP